jgi:NADH dehydrogenase
MSVDLSDDQHHVVIVGGGFAGVGAARRLARHDDVRVTLIDRNNYHQLQPLLSDAARIDWGEDAELEPITAGS